VFGANCASVRGQVAINGAKRVCNALENAIHTSLGRAVTDVRMPS
jgi:hypothetical protein